ncbi:MAG: class I SAM-dependent methyltransferase [Bacteroidales bacterium]|nr:class I SAM-dependent methyltransferase [Bacteroidales bacterium]HOY38901.1 class I SAM-dependent methyltransferase [Bacteroidales bacterium]HQP04109.1 class I SAM-dependent methyltransferase [Bacteroidales bacterium]
MSLKWKSKALVQKTISFFPFKEKLNYFFQKNVTRGLDLDDVHFGYKIQAASDHLNYLRKYTDFSLWKSVSVLELGTGWYPVVPVSMYLCGIGKITSIDIRSWSSKKSVFACIYKFIEWHKSGELHKYLPDIDQGKWKKLVDLVAEGSDFSLYDFYALIGMRPIVCDARRTGLDDTSFDFICSNNTFEHIHQEVLCDILKEFTRLLKKDGLMSHQIDMTDHFAHFDKSITVFNFLKYSIRQWKIIDNAIQPQNRLRLVDYKKMYEGLNIPVTEEKIWRGKPEDLQRVSVSNDFKDYSVEELVITHAYLISKF